MKRLFLMFVVMIITLSAFAQIEFGFNWVTGYAGSIVKFNPSGVGSTSIGISGFKYFSGGNSAISDSDGNLLLYSNGFDLYNKFGVWINDGDSLVPPYYYLKKGGSNLIAQASIILPIDGGLFYYITPTFSDSQYYDCSSNGGSCYYDLLLYNVVDMKANNDSGKVIKRMVPLMDSARLRKTQMMACRHGNGKDWWLLKNEGDSADVHTFQVTKDSIYDKGVQHFSTPVWGGWDIRGQSTFNSDGSKFATTSHGSSTGYIFLADFDRCNGLLSNPSVIQMPSTSQHLPWDTTIMERLSVGLCFSPNGELLYVISSCNIHQYDLVNNTWFHVAGLDTVPSEFQNYDLAYLAPDNRIYIGNFGGTSKQMSRIDNPNVKGAGCNFCPRCLRLDTLGAINGYLGTPPCMPNFALGVDTLNPNCWPQSQSESGVRSTEWVVYPNPAIGVLHFKHAVHEQKQLYNFTGQLMLSTPKDEMDVGHLAKGLYFVRCKGKVKKVVLE